MVQIQELNNIIALLKQVTERNLVNKEMIGEIQLAVQELNCFFYHSKNLKFQKEYNFENSNDIQEYIAEIKKLIVMYEQTLIYRMQKKPDAVFWEIYEYFSYVDEKQIIHDTIEKFMGLSPSYRENYKSLQHRYNFLQKTIDSDKGDFSLIEQHIKMLTAHIDDYKWLYERLQDYRSKMVLNGIVAYWFTFDINKMHNLCETIFSDYYDMDLLECNQDEVLVDLGAFTGDSSIEFIETYGKYKRIYAYEITPETFKKMKQNLKIYSDIITRQKGVGKQNGIMHINSNKISAGNKLSDVGEIPVEVVTLDDDIKEKVTIIKMDIEGAEKDALIGAKGHIQNEKPRLLISSYHLPEDIFEIPKLISSFRNDSKFYMRFNGHNGIWPCDYVLLAI